MREMIGLFEKSEGNYSRELEVFEITDEMLGRAHRIFEQYKAKEILLNGSFNDDVWKITDEKRTASLMLFQTDSEKTARWIGCTAVEFRTYVKAFVAFNLGELSVFSLQSVARDLLRLADNTSAEAAALGDNLTHIVSFLQIISGNNMERDWVIEQLSETIAAKRGEQKDGKPRILAEFQSYIRFNEVLADFWTRANSEEKLFYFPLYFWWNLTSMLPLRVTEFLLTPRNCLEERSGEYFITVRRSKLKSSERKKVAYRVAEDYDLHTYGINHNLANELQIYLKNTEKSRKIELDTLLMTEPHYQYMKGKPVAWGKRYYSYRNLINCMQYFYRDVIEPGNFGIQQIKLGDTRHIAMINLIISGGSPTICRELAGHADINISSRYYTNISTLVECATYERYRKSKGNSEGSITGEQKYPLVPAAPKHKHRVSGGFCHSESFARKDISECVKAVGEDGSIGDCRVCPHYFPDKQGVRFEFMDTGASRAAVDADCRHMMQMIEAVRKGMGYTEDIGSILLRLQHSSYRYSQCLWEGYENGKT